MISFAREKRTLVGLLAIPAPLPFVLGGILEWPVLVFYLLGVGLFLQRARLDPPHWLPAWLYSALIGFTAAILLPIVFWFPLSPYTMLAGFGLVAILLSLLSISREGDKWRALVAVFAALWLSTFLDLPLWFIAVQSAVYLGLFVTAMYRFLGFHVLAAFGRPEVAPGFPIMNVVVPLALATAALASSFAVLLAYSWPR